MTEGILFCTPMYGGMCHERYFYSCSLVANELRKVGIEHDWMTGRNESLVHRARMKQCREFLAKDYSHCFLWDADIDATAEDVAKLWNLCAEGADVAVGIYAMKLPDKPLSAWLDGKLVRLDECPSEPFAVDYAGTGFMLIKRETIERVLEHRRAKHEAVLKFAERIEIADDQKDEFLQGMVDHFAFDYEDEGGKRTPALFMTPIHNDCLESEDYHFCRLAREAGCKIIADPSIKLGHWGQYRFGT